METTCINESSIIPYNLGFHTNPQPQQQTPFGDPGLAMAQAFLQSVNPPKPKYTPPPIKQSKQDNYWKDVMNFSTPIPSFGVQDTRPLTHGELNANQNPQPIYEPLLNRDEFEDGSESIPKPYKPNDFRYSDSGTSVLDYNFTDVPVNGIPDIHV